MSSLVQRKDFTVRDDEILLRWILSGPAGAIEVYAPVEADGSSLASPNAEIHRHAFAPTPESCEAHRSDCDIMPGGDCYFTAWWGDAGRKAWRRCDDDVWAFLTFAYAREFNIEAAERPGWSA